MERNTRIARLTILVLAGIACLLAAVLLPAYAQPSDYHRFADTRALLGVPNFLDVATNAPFLLVGASGRAACISGAVCGRDPHRHRLDVLPLRAGQRAHDLGPAADDLGGELAARGVGQRAH